MSPHVKFLYLGKNVSWVSLQNPKYSKFNVFSPYHTLKLKIPKTLKTTFLYSSLFAQCTTSLSWDNIEPRYAPKRFLTSVPMWGRLKNFAKLHLSGCQALKTNLCTKIHESVFHRIACALLCQCVSEEHTIILYIYICIFIIN